MHPRMVSASVDLYDVFVFSATEQIGGLQCMAATVARELLKQTGTKEYVVN